MKALIIVLLLTACGQPKPGPSKSTPVAPPPVEVADPLVASYEKGLDLILVGSSFGIWYTGKILDYYVYGYDHYEVTTDYSSYYWDKERDTYYSAVLSPTNGFTYSLDSNLQYEKSFHPAFTEEVTKECYEFLERYLTNRSIPQPYSELKYFQLLYAGTTPNNERVYIDSVSKEQYIKRLEFLQTNSYYTVAPISPYEATVHPLNTPLVPFYETNRMTIIFSNTQGQRFYIDNHFLRFGEIS